MSKPTKRGPGRPAKATGDKPEQFSVRLPPHLKLGLEVYAADNNLSLSSAAEKAISDMLSSAKLSNGMTIPEVVDKVELTPRGRRLISLYLISERFVSVEDRHILDVVFSSKEMKAAESEREAKVSQRMKMEVVKFAMDHWMVISRAIGGTWWRIHEPISLHSIVFPSEEEVAEKKEQEEAWVQDFLKRTG
ncbi:hypothetical protein [Thermomonas carbonis]|uniref:Uncharacterized protein n=1 Tax=Thermomonas carbonis TaxID=1463158 RepID=A0A7G9SR95_9GAMM|nr:hypothetical protein [Thermomonas carbonis]QNN70370.1 hypothetical protein H9L16_01650 [Thermomonas carbonis]GHB99572.1 hypothetical protein GCM10010080_10530 [Thermomonas carbonis]